MGWVRGAETPLVLGRALRVWKAEREKSDAMVEVVFRELLELKLGMPQKIAVR